MDLLKRETPQLAAVVVLTFLLAVLLLVARGKLTAPTSEWNEQMRIARYLNHGTGFACPVGPERNDPSSWFAPGYIAQLAAIMAVFGETSALTLAAVRLSNIAAMSLAVGLYFLLGRRTFGWRAAWIAVVLIWLSPALMYKGDEIWDTSWTMLAGACLLAIFVLACPRRPVAAFGSGLACGLAALINPVFTLCYPLWVLHSWWRQRKAGRKLLSLPAYSGLILGGFLLAILPWTIRNYRTFGELFYLRGNLPLEIWAGNAPWADGYALPAHGRRLHPVFDPGEAQRLVELGEYEYFKVCRASAAELWRTDKGRFFRLSLRRIWWFWFGRYEYEKTRPALALKALGVAFPAVLAVVGTAVILFKRRDGLILVGTLTVFPLVHYATQIMVRYRLPIEPLVLLVGAVGLTELSGWGKSPSKAGSQPPS